MAPSWIEVWKPQLNVMVAFTFLPRNYHIHKEIRNGGRLEGWWKGEVTLGSKARHTYTFIRRVIKESEIMLLVQLDKGAHNPTSVFWEKLKLLGFELHILNREGENHLWHYISPSSKVLKAAPVWSGTLSTIQGSVPCFCPRPRENN